MYPFTFASLFVTAGLLFLHSPYAKARRAWAWDPPFKAWTIVTVFFFASNVFLIVVPLVPPTPGMEVFKSLPYWVCTHLISIPRKETTDSFIQLIKASRRRELRWSPGSEWFIGMCIGGICQGEEAINWRRCSCCRRMGFRGMFLLK